MPVTAADVDYWLFSGLRVTTADNNDVDNAALTFAALGQGPTTGATLTAYDVATLNATVPTTNDAGIPPRFRLTVEEADCSADGGVTWFSISTSEQAALRAELKAKVAEVEALRGQVVTGLADIQALKTQVEQQLASGGGGSGTAGGLYVVRAVEGAYPATEAAALSAAAAAGPQPFFVGPRDVAPPSWIADGDPIGLTPPAVTP